MTYTTTALFTLSVVFSSAFLGQVAADEHNATCWHTFGDWIKLADIPTMHVESSSTVFGKKLYVFSGFKNEDWEWTDSLDILDPVTNTWETKKMPFSCSHTPLAKDNKYIYGAGGLIPWVGTEFTKKVWRFSPLEDEWIDLADLPDQRWSGALTLDGDKNLHYITGMRERFTQKPNHWKLSEITDDSGEWEILPEFPQARSHLQGVLIDDVIYVVGGTFDNFDDQSYVHAYDTRTKEWTRKQDLPEVRSHAESGTLNIHERIIVLGGRGGPGVATSIVEYNTELDHWHTHTVVLPEPLETPNCGYIEDVEIQGQKGNFILVASGGEMKDFAVEWSSPRTYAIRVDWECGPPETTEETVETVGDTETGLSETEGSLTTEEEETGLGSTIQAETRDDQNAPVPASAVSTMYMAVESLFIGGAVTGVYMFLVLM